MKYVVLILIFCFCGVGCGQKASNQSVPALITCCSWKLQPTNEKLNQLGYGVPSKIRFIKDGTAEIWSMEAPKDKGLFEWTYTDSTKRLIIGGKTVAYVYPFRLNKISTESIELTISIPMKGGYEDFIVTYVPE